MEIISISNSDNNSITSSNNYQNQIQDNVTFITAVNTGNIFQVQLNFTDYNKHYLQITVNKINKEEQREKIYYIKVKTFTHIYFLEEIKSLSPYFKQYSSIQEIFNKLVFLLKGGMIELFDHLNLITLTFAFVDPYSGWPYKIPFCLSSTDENKTEANSLENEKFRNEGIIIEKNEKEGEGQIKEGENSKKGNLEIILDKKNVFSSNDIQSESKIHKHKITKVLGKKRKKSNEGKNINNSEEIEEKNEGDKKNQGEEKGGSENKEEENKNKSLGGGGEDKKLENHVKNCPEEGLSDILKDNIQIVI